MDKAKSSVRRGPKIPSSSGKAKTGVAITRELAQQKGGSQPNPKK